MTPDHDQLCAMLQKDKGSFNEYAQRWCEVAAQGSPPMEEREMTKMFLKMLSSFYYERMAASAPNNFTEMVGMGVHLEEGVREGQFTMESGSSNKIKKYGSDFQKKKKDETNVVEPLAYQQPLLIPYYKYPYVAAAQFQQHYFPTMHALQNTPQNHNRQ